MLKATLFILRNNGHTSADDDIIRFYDDDEYRDTVRVVYSTPELKKNTTFYFSIPQAMLYVSDMLKTFRHDSQPFEYVQVSTQLQPSVLYHVADLDDCDIRHLIEDTIQTALRRPIFRTKKEKQQ